MDETGGRDGTPAVATVVSVNVALPADLPWAGRVMRTAIVKRAVEGPVAVGPVGLDGDEQADPRVHGGPDKAVYAYGTDDYRWWSDELGTPLAPATFGENLTVSGLDVSAARLGERWRVGTTLLEVAQPRFPCAKLGARMGDASFVERFAFAGRPGAYLRVVRTGVVATGDTVTVVHRPPHDVTLRAAMLAVTTHDHDALDALLALDDIPAALRHDAERVRRLRS